MRILLVCHQYLPRHAHGTELYTAQVAAGLRERGHEVAVFSAEKDISRRHLSLSERDHAGLPVFELVNDLHYRGFRETWDYPAVVPRFADVLERWRPDLVHLQHLMYLSVGCAEEAARRGIPVAFTLHDFWLQCPRFGQRVHADGSVCHEIDLERCAGCMARFEYAQSPLERRLAGWLAGVRSATGVDLGPLARRARVALKSRAAAPSEVRAPDERVAAAMDAEVRARDAELRARAVAAVDRFLSPSCFLRKELVAWGIPAERIAHLPNPVDLAAFGGGGRVPRGERLRVAFVGSLIPVKGPGLLLEAWGRLAPGQRARAELELVGSARHAPGYQRRLAVLAQRAGARMVGEVTRAEVSQRLRRTDLLVVPSLWFENAPLVILEALAARTPLLVSDLGGMAELVEQGVSGFRFPMGDAGALAARLAELIDEPGRLDALYPREPELPGLEEHLDALEEHYAELRRARPTPGAGA